MSDLMFYGVLEMPYEMAMGDEISRLQFYSRVQEAVRRLKAAEAATEAAKATGTAAQDSAPAELPPLSIKTWQERLREKFPETADRNLFAVGHLEHAMESEIADLRAALSRPVAKGQQEVHQWRAKHSTMWNDVSAKVIEIMKAQMDADRYFYRVLYASPQPVAKVLTDTQEAAFELAAKTIELFDDKTMENDYMLDSSECAGIIRALKPSAIAALAAASTPTTLTEKKE